jgi:hypothetical protein
MACRLRPSQRVFGLGQVAAERISPNASTRAPLEVKKAAASSERMAEFEPRTTCTATSTGTHASLQSCCEKSSTSRATAGPQHFAISSTAKRGGGSPPTPGLVMCWCAATGNADESSAVIRETLRGSLRTCESVWWLGQQKGPHGAAGLHLVADLRVTAGVKAASHHGSLVHDYDPPYGPRSSKRFHIGPGNTPASGEGTNVTRGQRPGGDECHERAEAM